MTNDEIFWKNYSDTLAEAEELTTKRMEAYVADESILDFWINGPNDLVYEINKKMLRLRRQFKQGLTETTKGSPFDSVSDELIDMINYCAFLRAYMVLNNIGNTKIGDPDLPF